MKRPIIAVDKLEHYFVANIIAAIVLNFFALVSSVWYGYAICLIGFALYEVGQKYFGRGTASIKDWLFGFLATTIILITIILN